MSLAPLYFSSSTFQEPLPFPAAPHRAQLIELVTGDVVRLGAGRLRIAIDGRTASGKTSFGHELAHSVCRTHRGPGSSRLCRDTAMAVSGGPRCE